MSGDDNVQHTLHSSTPSTTTGEEEASEGLTPILQKWFLESSNGSAMGIGEGEQPSPVSILDSPFQDEVSITPEPSLAGHNFFLYSNQESYIKCPHIVVVESILCNTFAFYSTWFPHCSVGRFAYSV